MDRSEDRNGQQRTEADLESRSGTMPVLDYAPVSDVRKGTIESFARIIPITDACVAVSGPASKGLSWVEVFT